MLRQQRDNKQIRNLSSNSNRKLSMHQSQYKYQLLSNSDEQQLYEQKQNILNAQKTKRVKIKEYFPLQQISPMTQQSKQISIHFHTDFEELTNEINLQKDALQKANILIQMLGQQNQKLNQKILQMDKQLEETRLMYQQKLEKANNMVQQLEEKCRNQTAANSFMQYSCKNSKITPIKIYGKGDESISINFNGYDNETNHLQEISKLILVENMNRIEKQINSLEYFSNNQSIQLQNKIQQNKYIQAYLEDQMGISSNSKFGFLNYLSESSKQLESEQKQEENQEQTIRQLIKAYELQISQWQIYANKLKKQLAQCISVIENNFIQNQQKKKKRKKQYTNQDLVKFIAKQILKIIQKKQKKSVQQIKELRQILKDLFDQIKKNQWKFINKNQVNLP